MKKAIFVALAMATLSGCATITANASEPAGSVMKAEMVETGSPLDVRVHQLDGLFKRTVQFEDYFAPAFLDAVPAAQFSGILDGIIAQHGKPLYLVSTAPRGKYGATVQYAFERATATINIDILGDAPNKVIGLLITGFTLPDDSLDKVESDIKALPGQTGFIVAELGEAGNARLITTQNAAQPFAIGSTFKLYILSELAQQVAAGERKWNDVVPLDHRSFSSTGTRGWPKDSPVTLHTLASWMISLSDNSATDTLLHRLGREAVERRLASIGHSAPDKMLPFLSTVEAFAIKGNPALRDRFLKASEAQQRDLLDSEAAKLTLEAVDNGQLSKGPASIDTIEWFASPTDLLWLMNAIRAQKNDSMMSILGINPGLSPVGAAKWRYVGYKGGSESGVISMTFLLQSKAGKWFVASGSWNNSAQEVDNGKFAGLMERLVNTITE